jgi:ParB family chromosome partitioning protein
MDNKKRNIHNSGPLGMLINTGQVKKIEDAQSIDSNETKDQKTASRINSTYFKTDSGIEFGENDLIFVDPKECESWEYANRQHDEFGNLDELIESIKANKQLQPALIRFHPNPHDNIRYEIIFGRRRHLACLKLGIPFLAIRKNIPNIQDAIASQDAENKFRNDVSNYSNSILYKKLLNDKVFNSEKELADKLRISSSSLNDLMAYAKIPQDIMSMIPNVHVLSKHIVVKMLQLLNKSSKNHEKLLLIASQIGKSISSPAKLEQILDGSTNLKEKTKSKTFVSKSGAKLFVLKSDSRGLPSIVLNKNITSLIDIDELCQYFSTYIEGKIS